MRVDVLLWACGLQLVGGFVGPYTRVTRSLLPLRSSVMDSDADAVSVPGLESVRPDLAAKFGASPKGLLDEGLKLEESRFPIPAATLIGLTKAWLAQLEEGDDSVDWFSSDFRFIAPVVGSFGNDESGALELKKAFPDLKANPHHFRVDPFEPNRVWWSVKYEGTNTGPVMGMPATGKLVESPVQAQSVTFNERGEICKFTIGYVLDKDTGNTGGLGGVFGLFHAIGYSLPLPESQPGHGPSVQFE